MRDLTAEEYLEISRKEVAEAIEKIVGGFSFTKAAKALTSVRWRYIGATRSPNAKELRVIAKKITMQAIQSGGRCSITSGPLRVDMTHYDTPAVMTAELTLSLFRSSAVYIDGRVIYAKRQRKFTGARKATA